MWSEHATACVGTVLLLLFLWLAGPPPLSWHQQHGATHAEDSCPPAKKMVKVVCLGDTHGRHGDVTVPPGDVLVYTGDMTDPRMKVDNTEQLRHFNRWLSSLPHKHKVVVAGNHDAERGVSLEDLPSHITGATSFLQDEAVTLHFSTSRAAQVQAQAQATKCGSTDSTALRKLKIYGSPWQPQWKGDPMFATYAPEESLEAKWRAIPSDTDLLASAAPRWSLNTIRSMGVAPRAA